MRRRLYGLILLLPALVWIAAQLAMTSMLPQAAGAGPFGPGTQIVICSFAETRVVTIGADGQPVDDDVVPADCPLCTQISGMAPLILPEVQVVAVWSDPVAIGQGYARTSPQPRAPPRRYETRAPPPFASL